MRKAAVRSGATAAALLPSALAGAILVSAPFAGTTTSPLAHSTTRAATASTTDHPAASRDGSSGLSFNISPTSVAVLGAAELLLLGVGAGVIVAARRNRLAEESS